MRGLLWGVLEIVLEQMFYYLLLLGRGLLRPLDLLLLVEEAVLDVGEDGGVVGFEVGEGQYF